MNLTSHSYWHGENYAIALVQTFAVVTSDTLKKYSKGNALFLQFMI